MTSAAPPLVAPSKAPPMPTGLAEESEGWAETIWRHGAPPGARLRWLAPGLPVLRRAGALESLRSPYVTVWGRREADAVMRSGARLHRLEGIPDEAVGRLLRAYGRAGWAAETYRGFGVWHDDLAAGWSDYWSARPTRLRETVRRKGGRLGTVTGVAGDDAVEAQRRVAAAAWQAPEPFPRFVEAAIRRGGEEGWLRAYRLGPQDDPAALQLWLVGGGWASLAKTWHRQDAQGGSPGTVMTARVLERLASEGVRGFDLGRGDDPYKADWARFRAQRWGVLAAPLLGLRGPLIALRAVAKSALRRN